MENMENNEISGQGMNNQANFLSGGKLSSVPFRLIARITAVLAIICFLFPFVLVSCDGSETVSESYSGVKLMTSIKSDDSEMVEESGENKKPNVFVILAFGCGIASAVLLFIKAKKDNRTIVSGLSGVSALMLVIFRATFRSYYGLNDMQSNGMDISKYIKVHTKFGLVFCILMFLITAVSCFADKFYNKDK